MRFGKSNAAEKQVRKDTSRAAGCCAASPARSRTRSQARGGHTQPPPVQTSEDQAFVKVEGNSLTVRLNQVPLREALRDIARQTGLRIIVNSARDDRLSLAFAKLPVEEGLRQLIGRDNFIFLYTPARELKEVRVYASSQLAKLLPPLPLPWR